MDASPGDPGSGRRPRVLGDPASVIRALTDYHAAPARASSSLVSISQPGRRMASDGYGYRFLGRIEEHEELVRRMRGLDTRDRLLLLLWYAEGWTVTDIAARLQVSRVHCYRLRNRALETLSRDPREDQPTKASTPRPPRPIALPSSRSPEG